MNRPSGASGSDEYPAAKRQEFGWLNPTFVDDIGPPLEQLAEDNADTNHACGGMSQDILALIKEVKTLRWELAK